MTYKSLNLSICIRLLLFAISIAGIVLCIHSQMWKGVFLCSIITVIIIFEFLHYINGVNRKLTFFFDAIRNEDTTLTFPENINNKSLKSLHQSLNRLNTFISDVKIRNEHNERFFRKLLAYSATGLIAVDEQGYIDLINNSALKLIGLPTIAHISLLQQTNKTLFDCLMELKPDQARTVKLLNKEELQQVSVKVANVNFGNKKFKIFSIHDIKTEMEENEMDSWQKLIRVLTHEIMNSIAPITSLSNTLTRFYFKNGESTSIQDLSQEDINDTIKGLSVIEERGKGLMNFVEDYRKLVRVPKPEFKSIDVEAWINKITFLMKNRLNDEKIALKIEKQLERPEIIGDEKLLSQVIINLLANAIDAMKEKENKKIKISLSDHPDSKLKITITDNGKGIPEEELDKIFMPFYSTKEEGSGIGLSLSRQIMRLHKGSIQVQSTVDKQTTFILSF